MSDKLGPISYGVNEEEIFLGREITKHQAFSELTAQDIDSEVKDIIMKAMKRAEKILKDNIDVLHNLSKELLEREILDAEEINKIVNGEILPPTKKNTDEIPDHVKEMMKSKKNRDLKTKSENTDETKS